MPTRNVTVVIVIGVISAALMTPAQSLSVMLDEHIGTTLTVQLIAFIISDYARLMIILAPIAAMLIQMAISRSREYLADESET